MFLFPPFVSETHTDTKTDKHSIRPPPFFSFLFWSLRRCRQLQKNGRVNTYRRRLLCPIVVSFSLILKCLCCYGCWLGMSPTAVSLLPFLRYSSPSPSPSASYLSLCACDCVPNFELPLPPCVLCYSLPLPSKEKKEKKKFRTFRQIKSKQAAPLNWQGYEMEKKILHRCLINSAKLLLK